MRHFFLRNDLPRVVLEPQSQEEVCDLLHAAPFQNILPRVYIKGTVPRGWQHRGRFPELVQVL